MVNHLVQVLHPPSTGSHVKSIFAVTKEMLKRGHSVTTVRYEAIQGIALPDMGPNHTEIILAINNTDGRVPYVTKVGFHVTWQIIIVHQKNAYRRSEASI